MLLVHRLMLCLALPSILLAVGCSTQAATRGQALTKLQIGMTKEEVLSIMGRPQRQETRGNAEVLFYTTASPGGAQEDTMPITIIGGRLIGWGRLDYDSAVNVKNEPRDERSVN